MKTWLYKLTGILCAAGLCTTATAEAAIGNLPPQPKKQQISVKKESSRKSIQSTSRKSPEKLVAKNSSKQASKTSSNSGVYSTSNSTTTTSANSSVPPTQIDRSPLLVKRPLIIKKPQKTKKISYGKKVKRGKKGLQGKPGKRGKKGKKGSKGKKGEKGDPGTSVIAGFMSAINVGVNASSGSSINPGEAIKSFHVINNNSISYNPSTGIFESTAGPGYYEIHYGASWDGPCAVVLLVDGNEVNPFIDLNTPATWARESIIISSTAMTPTFALSNAKASAAPMVLANKGAYSSAFISIKKIS